MTESNQSVHPLPEEGDDVDLRHYLDLLLRRWWVILGCGLLAVGGTWWTKKDVDPVPVYTAEALVQRVAGATSEMAVLGVRSSSQSLRSELEILRTRSVLGPVVDSLGLRLVLPAHPEIRGQVFSRVQISPDAASRAYVLRRVGDELRLASGGQEVASSGLGETLVAPGVVLRIAEPGKIPPEGLPLRIRSRLQAIGALDSGLQTRPVEGTDLLTIAFRHRDPHMAAKVANGVAEAYKGRAAVRAREEARSRKEFIARRLQSVSDSLVAAQAEMHRFQAASESLNPGSLSQDLANRLSQARAELLDLQERERQLTDLVIALQTRQSDGAGERLLMNSDLVPAASGLVQNLQNYQRQRQDLISRRRRVETSPDVQLLDSLMVETRREILEVANETLRQNRSLQDRQQQRIREVRQDFTSAPTEEFAFTRLEQRVDAIRGQVDMLTGRYYEAQIAEAVELGNIEIIDRALVPRNAAWVGGQSRNLWASFALGTLVGLAITLVLDRLDTRIRRPEDVTRHARSEIVGIIPELKAEAKAGRPIVAMNGAVSSEAFRMLRTNLRFVRTEPIRSVAVTSAGPQEGKSVISANIAISMAQDGKRVLLVDGDLRRPVLHTVFEEDREPGLTDILVGEPRRDAIRSVAEAGIDLLPAGTPVPNPAELLGSDAFRSFIRKAAENYDIVVVDTPPVLAVTDTSVVATAVDGLVLVARQDRTPRKALASAGEQLRRSRGSILGVVVNAVDSGLPGIGKYSGAYGYRYGYGTSDYASSDEGGKR